MNPTQSSHVVFGSGGNDIPILTRASSQSTAGYQTMGLPGGKVPFPGGGANKTVLGPVRMGDQDGNAPGSAILPNDIFITPGQPDPVNPQRTFQSVGNNVFQPDYDDRATHALLKRLGDQKFKAQYKAPFEDYLAQQKLAKDLQEASRSAGLQDLGTAREIIRNLSEQRRKQNEDDYLRRMIDGGMTAEAARTEIENVRNANALQEARRVDDRPYQAKLLINKIAESRGVTSMVREPLTHSASIDNPDRSQAMAQAMGVSGGFGTAPLDANRQFLTPDFYRKFLRRSNLTQEASDEMTAFSNLLTGSGAEEQIKDPQSGFSLATIRGQERQAQIDMASEALASRLDAIRKRQVRVRLPLPNPAVARNILEFLYKTKSKKSGDKVLYSPETISDLNPLQLLVSINWNSQIKANGHKTLTDEVKKYTWGTSENPSPNWLNDLRKVAYAMNGQEQDVRIPFASSTLSVPVSAYVDVLNNIKQGAIPELRRDIESGRMDLLQELNTDELQFSDGPPMILRPRGAAPIQRVPEPVPQLVITEQPPPGAPGGGGGGGVAIPMKSKLNSMGAGQIEQLMDSLGFPRQGSKNKNIKYINSKR